jgi:hypothetical protein
MKKMPEEKSKGYYFIKIEAIDDNRIQNKGSGGSSKSRIKFVRDPKFKKFLSKIELKKTIEYEIDNNIFFYLKLNEKFHTKAVQDMIYELKFLVRSVLSSKELFVSINRNELQKLSKRKIIQKKYLKTIRNIEKIDNLRKIGESLRNIVEKKSDKQEYEVIILFMNSMKDEFDVFSEKLIQRINIERDKCRNRKKLNSMYCTVNVDEIKNIANLSFVRFIDIKQKPKLNEDEILVKNGEEPTLLPLNVDKSYQNVCIIDSGISEVLDDYICNSEEGIFDDTLDYNDHGTKVASLALFGDDILNKNLQLEPKAKIINIKVVENEDWDDAFDKLLESIEKYHKKCSIYNSLNINEL